jgi:chloride channel protein, CIC family
MMPKRTLNLFMLSLVSILVGIIAGCGAILFRGLIGFFHNLFFLGITSFSYDANQHTPPGPWGPYIILAPVIGAVIVSFLITKFAPEAKGHGVPEVMEATFYNKGLIRPVVAVVKALSSALSIGTGGSVGREGPIIQIGSSFGSTMSQILGLPPWQTVTLIAAGGGGGIAATFNTPVGGILFAVELLMHEVSARTLIPVVISTVTATYIGQAFFGTHPSFVIPAIEIRFFQLQEPAQLLLYVVLGGIIGVASAVFIKSIYWTEHLFDSIVKKNYYVRHMLGMFLVGVIFYLLKVGYGHYYVEGVGYSAIQDILSGTLTGVGILLLLFVLKLVVTSLTLGSGGSGGIFSPSLFLGATIGLCYGLLLKHILPPGFYINSRAYAVAGMAGMVGGVTGAALMSIIMIFEMTLDYSVIVPMVITVIISYGIRKTLSKESIYTLKLTRRGHHVPGALKVDFSELRQARDIMDPRVRIAPFDMKLKEFALFVMEQKDAFWFIVAQEANVIGILSRLQALQAIGPEGGESEIGQIANRNFAVIRPGQMVLNVDKIMGLKNTEVALVSEKEEGFHPEDVEGVVTIERVKWAIGEFEMLPK